jgi:hypothetical protein
MPEVSAASLLVSLPGYTPIQCACESGSAEVLLAILNSGRCELLLRMCYLIRLMFRLDFSSINKAYPVDCMTKLGDFPLHLASAFGYALIIFSPLALRF